MKEDFITSEHCQKNESHCKTCRADQGWRNSIASAFEWDGNCPLGHFKDGVTDRMVEPTIIRQTKFTDTTHCQSGHNCMTCRHSQGMRDNWKRKYEVPDDFDERCPLGKTLEQIKKEHPEKMKLSAANKKELDRRVKELQLMPSKLKMAGGFLLSMKEVAVGLMKGHTPVVPDEVLEQRVKQCESNECGKYGAELQKCLDCGCSFKSKLPLAEMECPLGFFSKYRKN